MRALRGQTYSLSHLRQNLRLIIREVLVSALSPLPHHLLSVHLFETLHTSLNPGVHLPLPKIYLPMRALKNHLGYHQRLRKLSQIKRI